jgi:predicted Na+-dependent transporter
VALALPVTLFALMFALGLGLSATELALVRHRPFLLLRALLGTCLLVPLLALLLLKLPLAAGVSAPAGYAIALMAICPSAPLTLRKAHLARGKRELAASLQVAAALLAVVTVPLLAWLFSSVFSVERWAITPGAVFLQVVTAQLLPLAGGIGLRLWQPAWAQRWEGRFDRLADGLVLLLTVVLLVATLPGVVSFFSRDGLALGLMAVMTLGSLAIGYLLAGRDPIARTTAPLVTSMRNPGLALVFASSHGAQLKDLKVAILAYVLITGLLSLPFVRWRKLQGPGA